MANLDFVHRLRNRPCAVSADSDTRQAWGASGIFARWSAATHDYFGFSIDCDGKHVGRKRGHFKTSRSCRMARAQYFVVRHENQWKISFNGQHYGPYTTQADAMRAAVLASAHIVFLVWTLMPPLL